MSDRELADRLKSARETVGLNLKEAADELGFANYQTLSQIEAGSREVKAAEVIKFARIYFCSVDYLLGTQPEKEVTFHLLWRRDVPEDPGRQAQVEKRVHYLAEQCHWLSGVLHLRDEAGFKFVNVTKNDISTYSRVDALAQRVRKLLDLGKRPALSLKETLEQDWEVKIFYESLSEAGSAASMLHPEYGAIIIINADEAPWRRNYDLAHELFHLITWDIVTLEELEDSFFFEDIEKKANRFASTLLLPSEEIKSELLNRQNVSGQITTADFVDVARDFGVSTQALAFRLKNIGLISFDSAQNIAKDPSVQSISQSLRWKDWGERPKSELLIDLAIKGLRKAFISRGKFAELCDIPRHKIDEFIEEEGKLNLDGEKIEIMDS